MFLYQIEERLRLMADNGKKRRAPRPRADGYKTIGIQVSPELYERLLLVKKEYSKGTMKEALLLAAENGCDKLLRQNLSSGVGGLKPTTWGVGK